MPPKSKQTSEWLTMTLYKPRCQLDGFFEQLDHLVDPHLNLLLVFLFASAWAARRVSPRMCRASATSATRTRRRAFHSSTGTARLLCATSSALTVVSAASASSNAREYSHRFLPTCDFVYGYYRYSASCRYFWYSTDEEAIIGEYQDDNNAGRGGRSDASDGVDVLRSLSTHISLTVPARSSQTHCRWHVLGLGFELF